MTNEQAKHKIDLLDFYLQNYVNDYGEESHTAMMMAIKALEQQTCEDAVSREAVLDLFAKNCDTVRPYSTAWEKIRDLPSVNPQPKWIPVSERLPEDSELVLFSTKTDRVFEGRFFADNTDRQWYAFRDETFAWNNVVTAWMPLPQPYEPQESEENKDEKDTSIFNESDKRY